ncbi:LysR family transcriptional regulator [Paraburkholderia sp. J12]|uniref:LysR family transcriptional regulator n=1 Tax=Paraburkholderia sp. J12 TaxID=2805432 RepID=UPI002ABD4344|nr:LysR family transcriptional regulator [Paraburkholderia sp. J12]
MDFRQLECFFVLAQELHFGRAAERLFIGQSSVSEAIRNLEKSIGGQLFERTSRRVSLTPLGEALRDGAESAFMSIKTTVRDCKRLAAGEQRKLKFGFLGGGLYELHRPLVAEFAATFQRIELEFVELSFLDHFQALVRGEVDVAVCRLPLGAPGLAHGPVLMEDRRMLCLPNDHPLAGHEFVDGEALAGERLVRMVPGVVNQEWQDFHLPRHTPLGAPIGDGPVVRTLREAMTAVSSRQGLMMLTRRAASYYATPGITFAEINLPPISSALVWRRDDSRPIIAQLNTLLVKLARLYSTFPVSRD